jgi:hypothetical protein
MLRRTVLRWAEPFWVKNSLKSLAKVAHLLLEQKVDHGGGRSLARPEKRLQYDFERRPPLRRYLSNDCTRETSLDHLISHMAPLPVVVGWRVLAPASTTVAVIFLSVVVRRLGASSAECRRLLFEAFAVETVDHHDVVEVCSP